MEGIITISVYFADGVVDLPKKIRFTDARIFVQKKAEVLILDVYNIPIEEFAKILDSCEHTICSYLHSLKHINPYLTDPSTYTMHLYVIFYFCTV